jgi:hypothetical protein
MATIKKHGLYGYNQGCRCFVCRRAKADGQARFRERKKQGAIDMPTGNESSKGDTMELLTRSEIAALGVIPVEAEQIAHIAIVTARLLDEIEKEGKWHLLNATSKRYLELMADLRGAVAPAPAREDDEDDDDFLRGLGTLGSSGAQPGA